MQYKCNDCKMSVETLVCSRCKQDLIPAEIEHHGEKIQVAKCENCQGMIKSPQCCGHDMQLI